MVKLVRFHYHDHVDVCEQCSQARDKIDPSDVIMGNNSEILKSLVESSCEVGRGILESFWMSYKDNES